MVNPATRSRQVVRAPRRRFVRDRCLRPRRRHHRDPVFRRHDRRDSTSTSGTKSRSSRPSRRKTGRARSTSNPRTTRTNSTPSRTSATARHRSKSSIVTRPAASRSSNCPTSPTTNSSADRGDCPTVASRLPQDALDASAMQSGRAQFGSVSGTRVVEQHVAVAHLHRERLQALPRARARDAFARLDFEQCAVHHAQDQRRAGREELVRLTS